MKTCFLLFAALFGIAVALAGGLFQIVQARHMRNAAHPHAGARAVMGWAGVTIAFLSAVIVYLNAG